MRPLHRTPKQRAKTKIMPQAMPKRRAGPNRTMQEMPKRRAGPKKTPPATPKRRARPKRMPSQTSEQRPKRMLQEITRHRGEARGTHKEENGQPVRHAEMQK